MGKDKKEKQVKEKKPSTGKVRGFVGALLAVLLLVGVGVCDTLLTGKNPFSFVSTGNAMDRFDEATAETSKKETEIFFEQAAVSFVGSADQKYTSYTLKYTANRELSDVEGSTYTNEWKEVFATVDKDYTVLTVTERRGEALDYARSAREYVLCKTGNNAGKLWGRNLYGDTSVGDVDLLEKSSWTQVSWDLFNEMEILPGLLGNAEYTAYDVVENKFAYKVEKGDKVGYGTVTAGLTPTVSFFYEVKTEFIERAIHTWECSNLNATTAIVPQSLLNVIGGNA